MTNTKKRTQNFRTQCALTLSLLSIVKATTEQYIFLLGTHIFTCTSVLLCGWRGPGHRNRSSSLRRLDFSGFGNSTRLPRTGGTHQRLLVRIPSLQRSFGSMIYTFWSERVLNSSIKELRGVPWVRHSNESTPMIAATFNRQKLVFSMLQTPMWRKLSGAEERGRDESVR